VFVSFLRFKWKASLFQFFNDLFCRFRLIPKVCALVSLVSGSVVDLSRPCEVFYVTIASITAMLCGFHCFICFTLPSTDFYILLHSINGVFLAEDRHCSSVYLCPSRFASGLFFSCNQPSNHIQIAKMQKREKKKSC